MIIANPIYDVVFKRLMENERVAKFFIGTLLGETVQSVEVMPQEFTHYNDRDILTVFRLDFIATILTETGEAKKVLIEIQKAQKEIDYMRFRNYLGEQYKKEETVGGVKQPLPITTIYILGFDLPEIQTPCLKVERKYRDLVHKTTIEAKSEFVEKLTHDSYVVQVGRVTGRYQTRLDKLLSVFEQRHFIDDRKIVKEFPHEADIEEVRIMTDILHHSGTNPKERQKIENEQEAWRTFNAQFEKEAQKFIQALKEKDQALSEKDQALSEKEQELSEKEQALSEKDQALSEKDQALSEKDQALSEKDRYIEELLKKLKEQGE